MVTGEAEHDDIQRLAILKSIDLFNELEIDSLYQILKLAQYTKFEKGKMIVRKGEPGNSFYIILEGQAGVLLDPDKEVIATISRGGMVGELSILDKQERTAWVVALEDILALEFDGEAFVSLIKANNAISLSMARTLSQRLRNTVRTRKNNA